MSPHHFLELFLLYLFPTMLGYFKTWFAQLARTTIHG
jgi:hypothetical protein